MSVNSASLLARLPHRPPMALVEQICDLNADAGTISARTAPFTDHEALAHSFRGPLGAWPPALALEAWCQAAGLLLIAGHRAQSAALAVLISRLADVSHLAGAPQGEPLILAVTRTAHFEVADQFRGHISTLDGKAIATIGQLTATVRPIEALKERL